MYAKATKDFTLALRMYPVWVHQAYHEISARYKRTVLGSLWISGQLVATSVALALVFGAIFGNALKDYLPYVMGGIMCFSLAGFCLMDSVEIFMRSSGIIRNHANPFSYYVFEAVARVFFLFLHNLVVFYIMLAIVGALVVPHWSLLLGIPVVLGCMFTWGTLAAMLAARFRDMRYLLPYIGTIVYFLTPILWHVDQLGNKTRAEIAGYNPFYGMLEIIRAPLLGHAAPANCWTMALVTLALGIVSWVLFFPPFRRRIAFWV